jgi:hypothetical protein
VEVLDLPPVHGRRQEDGQVACLVRFARNQFISDFKSYTSCFLDNYKRHYWMYVRCRVGVQVGHSVCILGFNSPEWFIADLAAISVGALATGICTQCVIVCIPRHPSLVIDSMFSSVQTRRTKLVWIMSGLLCYFFMLFLERLHSNDI